MIHWFRRKKQLLLKYRECLRINFYLRKDLEKARIRNLYLNVSVIDEYNRKVSELEQDRLLDLETMVSKETHQDLKDKYFNVLARLEALKNDTTKS